MSELDSGLCFGTLALGKVYRGLAALLATDLKQYAPGFSLVILTDRPQDFDDFSNVLAFKHRQQSVGCYHDKRCVIAKGLSLFNACLFIDADMRILAPVRDSLQYSPGIVAYRVWNNIQKHNKNTFQIQLLNIVANKLGLDLSQVSFIHECLFIVAKDAGKEDIFLSTWEKITPYFELNGYYRGEGNSIGLAAAYSGLSIHQSYFPGFTFFKDRFEKQKQKKGEILSQRILDLMVEQRRHEYPKQSKWEIFVGKILRFSSRLQCRVRLIFALSKNIGFYLN
jgi:hypothetical protein